MRENKQDFLSDNLNYFLFGALAFTVSSAWNSAFQNYFKESIYLKEKGPWLYAIFISVFAIICACLLYEATKKIKNVEMFLRNKNDVLNNIIMSEDSDAHGKMVKLKEREKVFYNT